MEGSRGTSQTKVHFKITFLHFSGVTAGEEKDKSGKTKKKKKSGQMRKKVTAGNCVRDNFD